MRALAEWIGKTDDTAVPGDVRLRILRKYNNRCYLTGAPIGPGTEWDLDHIKPLADGGAHRETNLAPALVDPHKAKTAREATDQARVDARAKTHFGILPPVRSRPIPNRPMPTSASAMARRARTAGRLPQPAGRSVYVTIPAAREAAHG